MTIEEVNKRLNQNYQPMLEAVGSSMPQEEKLKVVFEYIEILKDLVKKAVQIGLQKDLGTDY